MRVCALMNVWNSATFVEWKLREIYPLVDLILCDEVNWTSKDERWEGATSPDGTAKIIENFPDPEGKIRFRRLGYYPYGVLAARAELCARIPKVDWIWICDCDEFTKAGTLAWLATHLASLDPTYTQIRQPVKGFYYDFRHCTHEEFTRIYRWHPRINPWTGVSPRPPKVLDLETVPAIDPAIYHYSYVPIPAVEIKGAMSFDVPRERYQQWYKEILCAYDGSDFQEVYAKNQGGIHVFGGNVLHDYQGPHPEVLDDHPLRWLEWRGKGYIDSRTGEPAEISGWWNK